MTDARRTSNSRALALATFVVPALVALAFGWWMLARRHYILIDDAYISFRYAAKLATGHGLVWNDGVPVEGYTCLLWVVTLSVLAHSGLDLTWPALALSSLYGLGCLELLRRITCGREASAWDLLPGLLLASLPSFAHAMTSGMEETSFAFFALLGIHLLIRGRARPRLRIGAGLAFAAASLTRPEGPLIAGVALGLEALGLAGPRARLRELIAPASCVALVVIAHTAIRLAYYGYPLPNTFYAKVIFGGRTLERGIVHISSFLAAGGWLLLLGFPRARHRPETRPWIVHGYALALVYCAYLLFVGGDHPHWFRFYVPLVPLPLLGVAEQLRVWSAAVRGIRARTWVGPVAGALGCALFARASLPFSEADEPVVGVIDAPIKKLMEDVDRFFDEVPPDSFCAVEPIGHVGYRHPQLHILDIWGLTDTHIAHVRVAPTVKFGHDKQDLAYVGAMKPDYVYMFGSPAAPPFPGYDLCWPSENPPGVIYRRAFALAASDIGLGVPKPRRRHLEPPPPCRPPAFLASTATLPR